MKNKSPIEQVESEVFAMFLKLNKLENAWHIPNETRTPYRGELAKQKKMGVSKGIPDFIIVIPAELCNLWRSILLFVEMKRQDGKPYDVKPEQRRRLDALEQVEDVWTFVAFWAEQAINFVSDYLISPKKILFNS